MGGDEHLQPNDQNGPPSSITDCDQRQDVALVVAWSDVHHSSAGQTLGLGQGEFYRGDGVGRSR